MRAANKSGTARACKRRSQNGKRGAKSGASSPGRSWIPFEWELAPPAGDLAPLRGELAPLAEPALDGRRR